MIHAEEGRELLVSYKHKFIFIHVYKVAGTSVRAALRPYAEEPHFLGKVLRKLNVQAPSLIKRLRVFPHHAKATEVRRLLGSETYDGFFKFAFVRNPWDWQVSLYHFMLKDPKHPQHRLMCSFKDFDEYLEWRVTEDRQFQKDFVIDEKGDVIVDFIGRFETLEEDFGKVCERLNIDARLPHLNTSGHRDYRSYYNPRTIKMIEEHFRGDIEFFGYTFDGFSSESVLLPGVAR